MRDRPTEGGGNIPTMDSDVIVVGAGLAGLVVSYELAAADRSVIMLDSEPLESIGGQANWALGGLFMVNSSEQRRLRIHDSEELALADCWAAQRLTAARTIGRGAGLRLT